MAAKKKIFKSCDAKCRKEAILATTTSNPWVTELARAIKRPEKVVGLNFTKNPIEEKPIVALVIIGSTIKQKDKFVSGILGFIWLWTGIVYHISFFAGINMVAPVAGFLPILFLR